MTAATLKLLHACIVFCGVTVAASAIAEELQFYESLAEIQIGRVFLSPQQRADLDNRRGKAARVALRNRHGEKANPKHSPDAAGYIVSSSGRTRIWSNGDFIAADNVAEVTFPGDVEITRRSVAEHDVEPGAAEDGK